MRKLLLILFLLSATAAFAQEATLTVTETITKAVVSEVYIERAGAYASVKVEFLTAGDVTRRSLTYRTASGAELVSFLTAIGTARSGETGTVPRRFNFRVLGWLVDNNKIKDEAGNAIAVTLVP